MRLAHLQFSFTMVLLTAASSHLLAAEQYVLALTWQSAFCQHHAGRAECRTQTEYDYNAKNFSLHGLWPQNEEYCYVKKTNQQKDKRRKWSKLPLLPLRKSTRKRLEKMMPGTQSYLQRHEWVKHGSCDKRTPDKYYTLALNLLQQLNDSSVQTLFARNIGRTVGVQQLQRAMNQSFGKEAGRSVSMRCNRGLIQEIRIALTRPDNVKVKLDQVLDSSQHLRSNCRYGEVDRVGLGTQQRRSQSRY